jgi:uncharacterized HAD superfamily protein
MPEIITVDFDHTLAYEDVSKRGAWIYIGNGNLLPIEPICDLIKQKSREGFQIDIVTFRKDEHMQEVRDFVSINNLPITNIYNTDQQSKTPILKQLSSVLHIDDNLSVVISAEKAGIHCLLVNGNGEYDNNSTAKLFDQININY